MFCNKCLMTKEHTPIGRCPPKSPNFKRPNVIRPNFDLTEKAHYMPIIFVYYFEFNLL